LFGATGLAGLPLAEVAPLVQHSAGLQGRFDPQRFGAVALKRVRPVLSFKILSNMPISFISIFENLQGPNGVYNPWEGQGAHAVAAGIRAVRRGDASCALVGGCDVKTHELAFIALQHQGVFRSWQDGASGPIPAEGAVFLVLEDETMARRRNARIYARIIDHRTVTVGSGRDLAESYGTLLGPLALRQPSWVVSAADGEALSRRAEEQALHEAAPSSATWLRPKLHVGNLFASAAALQVALAAAVTKRLPLGQCVLANTLGHGSEKAAFLLEAV
jgi:3-oxoacyl-(acyl-carrier-protein) synthase